MPLATHLDILQMNDTIKLDYPAWPGLSASAIWLFGWDPSQACALVGTGSKLGVAVHLCSQSAVGE